MSLKLISLCFVLLCHFNVFGQRDSVWNDMRHIQLMETSNDSLFPVDNQGQNLAAFVLNGDTVYVAEIENISISSPRRFSSRKDYLKYVKYRRYALKVYPYAKEAIRIFREAQYVTQSMRKRKRKKYLKKLSKELTIEFEEPLKGLSKTQGKILVKMIERELETPMYDLIHMTQGKLKAFYWNQSSKLYGYRLKNGYSAGQNTILDIVLQDFDISYDISAR